MNLIRHFGLRTKIALPFVITSIALVLIGLFSIKTVRNLVFDTEIIAVSGLPAVSELLNADRDLYQALVAQVSYVDAMLNDEDGSGFLSSFQENADQAKNRFTQAIGRLEGTGVKELAQGFNTSYSTWLNSANRVLGLAKNGKPDQARALAINETGPLFEKLRDYYDEAGSFADQQVQGVALAATTEGQTSSVTILVASAVAIIISLLLFLTSLKLIIGAIRSLRNQLDGIAEGEGDLTQRVPIEINDDLGQLATSFNKVLGNLQPMIASIQELARELGSGSTNLARTAHKSQEGLAQQTDAISMVAAAINQMQSAVEEVAGNAATAAEITHDADAKAKNSAHIIRNSSEQVHRLAAQISKAVEVIRRLADDSNNITSVLDVIRGVAEQTNLLALNAAIEAARAGEQGRGFAVVADEVRTLAQRTQQSTEDIQKMITTLQNGVGEIVSVMESGSKEAEETEQLATLAEQELAAILEAMTHITDVNSSVASATEEQTQVIDEINQRVTEISELSVQSAELSRDLGSISGALEDHSKQLESQTGRFRV